MTDVLGGFCNELRILKLPDFRVGAWVVFLLRVQPPPFLHCDRDSGELSRNSIANNIVHILKSKIKMLITHNIKQVIVSSMIDHT